MNYGAIALSFKGYKERKEYFLERYGKYILGEDVCKVLIDRGFLTAPASTKYHGAYEGGLFDHSVTVANVLNELTYHNELSWEAVSSAYRIGILHDLCKIDQYKITSWGDGDKATSEYTWSDEPIVKGHGTKSVIYSQIMGVELTAEETACIIYHMGAFTDSKEWGDYTNAVRKYPNVLWTHTADMIASQIMGV